MAKVKTSFFCQNCGQQAPKWLGKCPSCGEWNTFVEEVVQKEEPTKGSWKVSTTTRAASKPRAIQDINFEEQPRILTQDAELNRVLGGGIVLGSMVLIGGEPGIGKSTLMLQIALMLNNLKVLYVSGEESEQQIKMRAERLENKSNNCFILTETKRKIFLSKLRLLNLIFLLLIPSKRYNQILWNRGRAVFHK